MPVRGGGNRPLRSRMSPMLALRVYLLVFARRKGPSCAQALAVSKQATHAPAFPPRSPEVDLLVSSWSRHQFALWRCRRVV